MQLGKDQIKSYFEKFSDVAKISTEIVGTFNIDSK